MFCRKCGTKNNDNAKFCVNCGEQLSDVRPVKGEPEMQMELLHFFPLNRKIRSGQISTLIKAAVKYFLLIFLVQIVVVFLYRISIGDSMRFVVKISHSIVLLYISMGMLLSVLMFLSQGNADIGGV